MARVLRFAPVPRRRFAEPPTPSQRVKMLMFMNDVQIIMGFKRSTSFDMVAELAHILACEARAEATGP